MAEAEGAVADQDVLVGAVGGVGIGVRSFASLEGDGIVVDLHIAVVDQDVGAGVEIDGVGAGGLHRFHGRKDIQVDEPGVMAFIKVGGPEACILEAYIADEHRVAVLDEDQAWAGDLQVGALGIFLAPLPEGFPVFPAIAVDGSLSGNGETVTVVCVDHCREVVDGAPFHAGGHHGEVGDVVGTQEECPFEEVEVDARLKEEGSCAEASLRNHDHPASGCCRRVDGDLDKRGIEGGAVAHGPEGSDTELWKPGGRIGIRRIVEPGRNFRSVGPEGGLCVGLAAAGIPWPGLAGKHESSEQHHCV